MAGGSNIDVGGISGAPLVAQDSNPGRVRMSFGGVGRNIAHNLSLLGADVRLFTAFGDDLNGERLAASCAELGIDVGSALCAPDASTSTYLFISGPDGDMALAVSDMEICERLTPAYFSAHLPLLNRAELIVADANLP